MTAEDKLNSNNVTSQSTQTNEISQSDKKPAPDGGYGWVVLIASFFVSFILDGIMYSFGVILTPIKEHYKVTDEIGNLLSCFNTGFLFCSGPIVAGLANQFGCRAVVMGGAVITSLMYFLSVFSPSIVIIMITYGVIGGLSTGCTYIASLIIIAEYFDKKRGIATGITMAGSGVGSFAFAPLIGILIKHYDWKFTMTLCACVILQSCVCGALLKPLNPTPSSLPSKKTKKIEMKSLNSNEHQHTDIKELNEAGRVIQTFHGSVYSLNEKELPFHQRNSFLRITIGILKEMADFRLLAQNVPFLLITMSNFVLFIGYFMPFLNITKVAEKNGIENAPWLISIIGIVNIPFRMLYGFVADKRYLSPINLNTLAVAIATVSLFLYAALQYTFWTQAVFSFLFAIGIAGMNSLTTMYLCDLVGLEKFSNATGIINLFRGFGCFIGPFLGGVISDKFGMIESFFFSAICFVIGLILTALVSFGSLFKKCCNKSSNESVETTNNKTADESDVNKNLLNKA